MHGLWSRIARFTSVFATFMLLFARLGTVSAQTPEVTGVDGDTYTSPTYGYSLSWDSDIWSPEDEESDSGYDLLNLSSEGAQLYVEGLYWYQGNPDDCLDGERFAIADDRGLDDLAPLSDADGNDIVESGDGYAYGIYGLPESADPDADLTDALYLECRTIVPNSVVMIISAYMDPNDIGAQEDLVFEVVDTIVVGIVPETTFDSGDLEQEIRLATTDIDTYWDGVFSDLGQTYENPKFISYIGPIETECGDADSAESGPFYCPSDNTVYLASDELNDELLPYGLIVVEVVIAHEIGHHVQALLGLTGCTQTECGPQEGSLAIELQADCFAGAWTQDAAAREFIQASDIKRVDAAVKSYLGDPEGTPTDDPDAHGSGDLRDEMYQAGLNEGLSACALE